MTRSRALALLLLAVTLSTHLVGSTTAVAATSGYTCRSLPIPDLDGWTDDFVAGKATIPSFHPVDVGTDIDWSVTHVDSDSWEWRFQSLQWVLGAFMAADRLKDGDRALPRAQEVIHDWWQDNRARPTSERTWDPMGTGLRAQVLACASLWWPDDPVLEDAVEAHAARLSDPDFHIGNWNQGFEQDLGLLALACVGGPERADWMARARDMVATDARSMVDEQGAVSDQAVGYSAYVHRQMTIAAQTLRSCGELALAELGRRHLIPDFQAHATRPDGTWARLGDTRADDTKAVAGTTSEFAATQGRSGVSPTERRQIYDRGWAFSRSGWGERRPFASESHVSLRWGPRRQYHGHVDHTSLTWYARGRDLLVDAGFGGYSPRDMREYERREFAHNQVVIPDREISWDRGTELVAETVDGMVETYLLRGHPYKGVSRSRALYLDHDADLIVVRDVLSADTSSTFEQLWHLPPDARVSVSDGGHRTVAQLGDRDLTVLQATPVRGTDVRKGQTSPTIQGWVAAAGGKRVPAPVLAARRVGTSAEYVTVLALTPRGETPRASLDGSSLSVQVGGQTHTVHLGADGSLSDRPQQIDSATERLSGNTRIETSVAISRDAFAAQGTDYVVLARADNFADALSGTPLALDRRGPLLLTDSDRLSPVAREEIDRVLRPGGRVFMLGGHTALSTDVERELRDRGLNVSRVAGPSRYETAVEIARLIDDPGLVLLVDGTNFPDALAAGAATAGRDGIVLLTAHDRPAPATTAFLGAHEGTTTVAIGGPAATAHPSVGAIVGGTREETSVKVARRFFNVPMHVGVARSDAAWDALAGGAHAGRAGAPLLLTRPERVDDVVTDWLCEEGRNLRQATLYGGTSALAPAISDQVRRSIAC